MGKLKIAFMSLGCISACILIVAVIIFLPDFVSYEEKDNSKNIVMNTSSEKVGDKMVKYKVPEEITEKPPFVIKNDEDNIYVYKQEERLYSVKARLSDFPDGDVTLINKGIVADSFSQLCEIISYMES